MRKFLITSLVVLGAMLVAAPSASAFKLFGKSKNTPVDKTVKVGKIKAIDVEYINVKLTRGKCPGTATVDGPKDYVNALVIDNKNGILKIGVRENFRVKENEEVPTLTLQAEVYEIDATLAAKVEVDEIVGKGDVELYAATAGSINIGRVKAKGLDIDAVTAGVITIAGVECSDDLDIEAATAGKVSIDKANASSTSIESATAANVVIPKGNLGSAKMIANTAGVIEAKASAKSGKAVAETGGSIHCSKSMRITTTNGGIVTTH